MEYRIFETAYIEHFYIYKNIQIQILQLYSSFKRKIFVKFMLFTFFGKHAL